MKQFFTENGVSIRTHAGDAMTLLAFDLDQSLTKNFVGFTVQFKAGNRSAFLYNRMTFKDDIILPNQPANKNERLSSEFSPIQKYRWVHVPSTRNFIDRPFFGEYTYTVTPRYVVNNQLEKLDPNLSASATVNVQPFKKGALSLSFTRAFLSSQAYAANFGNKLTLRPKNKDLVFDIKAVSGTAKRWNKTKKAFEDVDFTYEEQHKYLGWQARERVMEMLDEVLADDKLKLDVFAYDLNEPEIVTKLIKLAQKGRVRIILDNYPNHVEPDSWETKFESLFNQEAANKADLFRGHYQSQSHSKIFIVRKNNAGGEAVKVLTGSTNFTTNGLYINANHTIVIDDREVAQLYADVFDNSLSDELMDNFKKSKFASQDYNFKTASVPEMTIRFSPHGKDFTTEFFKTISDRIKAAESDVLFAIMIDNSKSSILDAVREQIDNENVFTYGITDERDNIKLYKPNSKRGIRISALNIETNLPPPFNKIIKIGLGHVIHHKFIVVDFKGKNPVVYCGSSNLAFGPEQKNGDNLIEIHDRDVVTAFAIEAIRLIDHFHWLNRKITDQEKQAGYSLRDGREPYNWYAPYYKDSDLKFVERNLLIKKT